MRALLGGLAIVTVVALIHHDDLSGSRPGDTPCPLGNACQAVKAASAVLHDPLLAISRIGPGEPIDGCHAVDGDTLRCGAERIRLLGIDAPELPGHCRSGRRCAPGDPFASTARLAAGLVGPLRIARAGRDHYGRTLALVAGRDGDLSCRQLAGHAAIYRADWDAGGRVAMTCPVTVRAATGR